MKFGALLKTSAREMPELQGLFNCYKQLKKRLKRLPERAGRVGMIAMAGSTAVVAHERAFVALLVSDIQAFNESYVEKEEQSVIKLSLLEERLLQAHQEDQRASLYKDFVNFHGQTLMLVHWSILAYTSVLKILKKHHKRTGLKVQEFNMQQLLSQPFCSVELASDLVRKAEAKAQELASLLRIAPTKTSASFASSHSSPVAGELMTAARESVQGISASAAKGNEALEQHLTEQPSSSEDLSVDLEGAEVVSSKQTPIGSLSPATAKREAASELHNGLRINTQLHGRKRSRSISGDCKVGDPKRVRTGEDEAVADEAREACPKCDAQFKRTMSVASENHIPVRQQSRQHPAIQSGDRSPVCASGGPPSVNGSAGNSISSGSKSGSKSPSPPLTMGQGWFNGTSENILRQTQMALGLWEQLHDTAATPSTVVPPLNPSRLTNHHPANSAA